MDDFLDWWETITDFGLSVADYQQTKAATHAAYENKLKLQSQQAINDRIKTDNALKKDMALKVRADNKLRLKEVKAKLEEWDLNATNIQGLPEQFKTPEAQQILNDSGISLNNDLSR